MVEEGVNFVVWLNTGNRVDLVLKPGERVFWNGVYYLGNVKGNLAVEWRKGFGESLWVFSSLEPSEGLEIYRHWMKIEEGFKDLKSLLHLEKIMNKKRENMERIIALVFLAYAIGFLVWEVLRERLYQGGKPEALLVVLHSTEVSGEAVSEGTGEVLQQVWELFRRLVRGFVRSRV